MKKDNQLIKKVFIPLIFLIVFCLEASVAFGSIKVTKGKSDILYSYKATPSGTYNVGLKDNSYIDSKQLGMNQLYISKLVNTIYGRFNYQYSGSEEANLTYTYGVEAEIIGEYQTTSELENKRIWNKKFTLVPYSTKTVTNEKGFSLAQDVNVNFEQYNNIVTSFSKEINIPMDAYLSVVFKVNVRGVPKSNVGTVSEESTYELKIPLDEQAFQITTKAKANENQSISKITNATRTVNSLTMLLAGAAFVVTAFFFFKYCQKTFASIDSPHRKRVQRILKEYGDIIVEINTLMDISRLSIVEVKSFNELMDLEAELRIPILYYENGNDAWFLIHHENQLYRFILRDEEQS